MGKGYIGEWDLVLWYKGTLGSATTQANLLHLIIIIFEDSHALFKALLRKLLHTVLHFHYKRKGEKDSPSSLFPSQAIAS